MRNCGWIVTLAALMLSSFGCDGQSGGGNAAEPAPSSKQPNIIFILADDQAPGTLGFEGNAQIRTPHLDQMAAEGTYFSRAYNVLPQCAPSRACLLTGFYPHKYGPMDNDDAKLDPQVETVADLLKAQGYRTGMVGKWHLGNPLESQSGFDYWVGYDRLSTARPKKYLEPAIVANGEKTTKQRYLTDVFGDYAIEFIDKDPEQRFFLWLAFHAPHEPVTPHPDFPYSPDDMVLPENMQDDLSLKPRVQRLSAPAHAFRAKRAEQLKRHKAAYYSMISAVDSNVGRILEHLRKTGRDKDTLVVYMSDNGWLVGEHQMFSKGPAFYEELVRTPLLFWQPGTVPAGGRRAGLVSSEDIQPTLVRRAGGAYPAERKGYNLWPMVLGEEEKLREVVMLEYVRKSGSPATPMVGVVGERYKATMYLGSEAMELYDLQSDPLELKNLANEPGALQGLLDDYRARIVEFARVNGPFTRE